MTLELVQLTGENQCEKHVTEIKRGISNIAIQFVSIGYDLYKIKEFKLYKEMGYKNLEEFGIKELNLKSSSIYNFINVCMNFSRKVNGYPTMALDDKYLGYGYTQLTEMLALAPEQREDIKKDMSIKEIREVKKNSLKSVSPVEVYEKVYQEEQVILKENQIVIDAVIAPKEETEKTFTLTEIKKIFANNISHSKDRAYKGVGDTWQILDDLLTDTLMDFE